MPLSFDHNMGEWVPLEAWEATGASFLREPLPVISLHSDDPLPQNVQHAAAPLSSPELSEAPRSYGHSSHYGASSQCPSFGTNAEPSKTGIWLDGDVLMCPCPDCGAPMSIRLWLLVADCWRCGTSIELSEEQQREAERLLREREAHKRQQERQGGKAAAPKPVAPPPVALSGSQAAATASTPASPVRALQAAPAQPPRQGAASPPPVPGRAPTPPRTPPRAPARSASQALHRAMMRRRLRAWLNDTPAWLVSLVVHLILIVLLGLITIDVPSDPPFITLSNMVNRRVLEGDNVHPVDPENEFAFDLPLPTEADLKNSEIREALIRADQDARELRLAENAPDPFLPPLENVKERLRSSNFAERTLAARDPRVRTVLVTEEGGTTLTEAAVARGLRWLARQQKSDGRWVLDGAIKSDPAATSLALLPFLGAGQTHLTGRYQKEVGGGLRWLLANQRPDGDLAAGSQGNSHMYAHGQAAIVLCEAFAITGDEQLRGPAQKAIDFIVAAQHPEGGWRYSPGQAGDTSVLGWQLMALQSARAAKLDVPPATLENASHYLDSVSHEDGAKYGYQRGSGPTQVMTAEALLCRMYLGWTMDDYGLSQGVEWLSSDHLPSSSQNNFYYWYYGTQVFHHVGGLNWEKWNVRLRDILVNTQEDRGEEAGSWRPEHHHDRPGGRIYATSLAVCTLEVYYRHTPIFRQINVD